MNKYNGRWQTFYQRLGYRIRFNKDCWEVTGCADKDGYAILTLNNKKYRAHRLIAMKCGMLTECNNHLLVCHSCDNRLCINPSHLFLGTAADNSLDARAKDRLSKKFKLKDIDNVIRLWNDGKKATEIAAIYSTDKGSIYRLIKQNYNRIRRHYSSGGTTYPVFDQLTNRVFKSVSDAANHFKYDKSHLGVRIRKGRPYNGHLLLLVDP